MIPCVLYEDEHLLVVNKPAGLNTHAPSPYANEGIYEWLRCREKRWSRLSIIHRLDKETSGLIVFGLTDLANHELTNQFATRKIEKKYLLLTDRALPALPFTATSKIARAGEKYESRPAAKDAQFAETRFEAAPPRIAPQTQLLHGVFKTDGLVQAKPVTGRTHQIRVHAAENGFPILGDVLYDGTPGPRVCLHSAELSLIHPKTREKMTFAAPADFAGEPRAAVRAGLIDPDETDAFRLVNGAADKSPGLYLDKLGEYLLVQTEKPLNDSQRGAIGNTSAKSFKGVYHKTLSRQIRGSPATASSPKHLLGNLAPEKIEIRENGVSYELSFREGYSVGLFLDQRDNRRRLLTGYVSPDFELRAAASHGTSAPEALNLFAYTCGFSVCAAKSGYRATSLDLSKKYLDWGKRNFELNNLNPADHDFIYGDAFDWLNRLAKKQRRFEVVLIDPPTFSQSRESGVFRVEKEMPRLVILAAGLLNPNGVMFVSSNSAAWKPESFVAAVETAVKQTSKKIIQHHFASQPPDFPASREEPPYLKTMWLKLGPC